MKVAVFRPADDRLAAAVDLLTELGVEPIADPMLSVEPSGALPRTDADYVVLTSQTGADLVAAGDWEPGENAYLCAIGEATAEALRERGYTVDVVPEEFSSAGLVTTLEGQVAGACVEVARSDHGSPVLLAGLRDAGAYVHETVLYRLQRPPHAGESIRLAARGELDAVLFTSSLTVEHFLAEAADQSLEPAVREGLEDAVVGVIGEPTRAAAREREIAVDVVAPEADFETLAHAVVAELEA